MKRILCFVLLVCLLLGMGCQTAPPEAVIEEPVAEQMPVSTPEPTPEPTPAPTPTPVPTPTPIHFELAGLDLPLLSPKDITLRVVGVRFQQDRESWLHIDLEFTNAKSYEIKGYLLLDSINDWVQCSYMGMILSNRNSQYVIAANSTKNVTMSYLMEEELLAFLKLDNIHSLCLIPEYYAGGQLLYTSGLIGEYLTNLTLADAPEDELLRPEGETLFENEDLTVTLLDLDEERARAILYFAFPRPVRGSSLELCPLVNGIYMADETLYMQSLKASAGHRAIVAFDFYPCLQKLGAAKAHELAIGVNLQGSSAYPMVLQLPLKDPGEDIKPEMTLVKDLPNMTVYLAPITPGTAEMTFFVHNKTKDLFNLYVVGSGLYIENVKYRASTGWNNIFPDSMSAVTVWVTNMDGTTPTELSGKGFLKFLPSVYQVRSVDTHRDSSPTEALYFDF